MRSNVSESVQMPLGDYICDKSIFSDKQVSTKILNLALTMASLPVYDRRTDFVEACTFMKRKERIDGEHPDVSFRNPE